MIYIIADFSDHPLYQEIGGELPGFAADVGKLIDNIGLKREVATLLEKILARMTDNR